MLQYGWDVYRSSPALRQLTAPEHEVFVRRDVVGKIHPTISHEDRWPYDRMEWDVVLTQEVIVLDLRILPESFPIIRLADDLAVFLGCAQISDDRIEPNVDHLVLPSFHRNGYPPIHVPRYRTVVQTVLQPIGGECFNVRSPEVLIVQVLHELFIEGGEFEEIMLCPPYLGFRTTIDAMCILQIACLERLTAGITLIPAYVLRTAIRTCSLYVSVRKELTAFRAVVLIGFLDVEISVLQESEEYVLYDLLMILCVRLRE